MSKLKFYRDEDDIIQLKEKINFYKNKKNIVKTNRIHNKQPRFYGLFLNCVLLIEKLHKNKICWQNVLYHALNKLICINYEMLPKKGYYSLSTNTKIKYPYFYPNIDFAVLNLKIKSQNFYITEINYFCEDGLNNRIKSTKDSIKICLELEKRWGADDVCWCEDFGKAIKRSDIVLIKRAKLELFLNLRNKYDN